MHLMLAKHANACYACIACNASKASFQGQIEGQRKPNPLFFLSCMHASMHAKRPLTLGPQASEACLRGPKVGPRLHA